MELTNHPRKHWILTNIVKTPTRKPIQIDEVVVIAEESIHPQFCDDIQLDF